jgi:polysaccharide biosynthesis/export protein
MCALFSRDRNDAPICSEIEVLQGSHDKMIVFLLRFWLALAFNFRMQSMRIKTPVVIFSLLLSGCFGGKQLSALEVAKLGNSQVQVVESNELPPPDRTDLLGESRPYLIGPFDKLTIDVFGIEELSKKEVQTDASGRISFPLAGVIDAAGRTPNEVEQIIEAKLRGRYVRDPQVTVNLKETVSQVIAVDGEVKQSGLFPVVGKMTLLRAVAIAGGTSEFAKLDDVIVFRTVNGQKMAGLYNLKAIRQGVYNDPEVFANDVVYVGDSPARRRFKDILQVAPLLTTPLVFLLQKL